MISMQMFSSKVKVVPGEPLGGGDPDRFSKGTGHSLEINGITLTSTNGDEYRLCSVDALYAGRLVDAFKLDVQKHIFAASHTHYAPMLDDSKPEIGGFSQSGYDGYVHAIRHAEKRETQPRRCRFYRAEVDVPVYRRFDYPDNFMNRVLTSRFGFYPNEAREIDRNIYLYEFGDEVTADFVVVYHACHPVTQGIGCELSPDYVGAIREAVRARFDVETVIFLQGCAGDVRPNIAKKRIAWLPRFRLNWKFNWVPSASTVAIINEKYASAVGSANKYREIMLVERSFEVQECQLALMDGRQVSSFRISLANEIEFIFLPFEVSHLYHLDMINAGSSKFIVSCTNDTGGYLSHPSQHRAGGYEVNGSLQFMGQSEKFELKESI